MKKTTKSLRLVREHIRLLTPTDLAQVAGGATKPSQAPTVSDHCSNRAADTCRVVGG